MIPFEEVRQLIAEDRLREAFAIARQHLPDVEGRDTVFLLEGQLTHWEKRFESGQTDSTSERNRIAFGFLGLWSEYEQRITPSLLNAQRRLFEERLELSYAKIADLEQPKTSTEAVIDRLATKSPERLAQLQALLPLFIQAMPDNGQSLALLDFWTGIVTNTGVLSAQDARLLSRLASTGPQALLQQLNERRHRDACIRVLEDRIARERDRYARIGTAGVAMLLGYWLSNLLADDPARRPFGRHFNAQGYDRHGYDPDGFNHSGEDESGHHFLPFLNMEEVFSNLHHQAEDDIIHAGHEE